MSYDLKLSNNLLHIPKLPADGKGFVVWNDHLEPTDCMDTLMALQLSQLTLLLDWMVTL